MDFLAVAGRDRSYLITSSPKAKIRPWPGGNHYLASKHAINTNFNQHLYPRGRLSNPVDGLKDNRDYF